MGNARVAVRRVTRRDMLKAGAALGIGAAALGSGLRPARARQGGYSITFIPGVIADEFYVTMGCGIEAKARELGITVDTQGPNAFDATVQTPILNAVIQTQPDAILIAPTDTQAMIAPLQAAVDAGIAVFLVDTTVNADFDVARIASDNVEGGRLAARSLAEAVGGSGKVFVINVKPGISTTDQREQGFREALADFPDIEYLGQEYCNDDQNQATQIANARLQSDPDLVGIFGTNLFAAQGAAAGIRQQGKQGQVRVVGFDAGPTQVQDLRSEVVDLLIAQHPGDIGVTAVQLAYDFLSSGQAPTPKAITTGFTTVTRDNIDDPDVAKYLYISDCSAFVLPEASPAAGTPAAALAAFGCATG